MRRNGFSLLEVALALAVGLALLAAGVYSYKQHMRGAQINQAKIMLAGMRQEISMQRYRTGSYPLLGADYTATPSLRTNTNDLNRSFYDLGRDPSTGRWNLLRDTLYPPGGAYSPIVLTTDATASWGGWRYDPTTGELLPNLPDAEFAGDPPSQW